VAALERVEVEAALRRARGVKSRAAQLLGLSRPTLDKKIADLSIDLWREDDATPGSS
jgi:DNA-binding NtrC family response regulator